MTQQCYHCPWIRELPLQWQLAAWMHERHQDFPDGGGSCPKSGQPTEAPTNATGYWKQEVCCNSLLEVWQTKMFSVREERLKCWSFIEKTSKAQDIIERIRKSWLFWGSQKLLGLFYWRKFETSGFHLPFLGAKSSNPSKIMLYSTHHAVPITSKLFPTGHHSPLFPSGSTLAWMKDEKNKE